MMDSIAPASAGITITTSRFGTPEAIMVVPAALYSFPEAMPGLEESHRFALIDEAATAPFRWLQSLDEVRQCLPLLGLDVLPLAAYAARVAAALGEGDEVAVAAHILLICRFDHQTERFVANLVAPIVLDPRTATGRQVILEGQDLPLPGTLRVPLLWDAAARAFAPC